MGSEPSVEESGRLKGAVHAATPHSDDHPVQSVSGAIDTSSAIYQTLDALPTVEPDLIAGVAKAARDAVHMEILLYGNISEAEPGFRERTERHPWMQRELALQVRDLQSLAAGEGIRKFMLRSRSDAHR
jgi:uncharacterized protein DUF416